MTNNFAWSKILVVNPDETVCESLGKLLEGEKFLVETARHAEEANTQIDKFFPHCVVLDIATPYLTGYEAVRMIQHRVSNCQVIFTTPGDQTDKAQEAVNMGAFTFVTSPVDTEELLKKIQDALQHRKDKNARAMAQDGALPDLLEEGILPRQDDLV